MREVEMTLQESSQEQLNAIPLPDLESVAEMHLGIANRMAEIQKEKEQGKPIIWGSLITPKEIVFAMGLPVLFQEVLGAWVSTMGQAGKYCQKAEDLGFSRDTCAIHRCIIGCVAAEERDPFFQQAFTEPDAVIGASYGCISNSTSFHFVVNKFDTPYYLFDCPINTWGLDIPDHAVDYLAKQLRGMIEFLEGFGYKMDWDRLKEEVQFTKDLTRIVEEVDVYRRASPTPMKAFDSFTAAVAPLTLPESVRTLSLFERLRDEVKARVERGEGIIDEEKLRLLWMGVPPVCDMTLLNYSEKHGAVIAKNMLEYLVGFPLDPDRMDPDMPLESIALGLLASPVNPPYQLGIDYVVNAARDYRIDGVISVVKRGCGLLPGMQRLVKEALQKELGIPSIVFDLDGVDEREFDENLVKSNIDSFVETLLVAKGA
jgi:benzoyl-CoA reductase/2-hydroxyglutaryl-CoA dehydratase subunit BcrC/BadD/HgdB